MQRRSYNTVTQIPILIPCSLDKKQGEVISSGFTVPVREVTEEDKNKNFGLVQGKEVQHFTAIVYLLTAMAKKDRIAARTALQRLSELRASRTKALGEYPAQFGRLLAGYYGLQPAQEREAIEIFEGRRLLPSVSDNPEKVLWDEIAGKLLQVQLVPWWKKGEIIPALYCNDPKAVPYVYFLVHKKWGLCSHCGEWFRKDRPDQEYCTIAHREAHRVARWRARKEAKSKKKGDKRGTQKAR